MHHSDSRDPAPRRSEILVSCWLACVVLAGWCQSSHAQSITQTNNLKPGWNAVYLHVDASHTNLNSLINALDPTDEVWLWTFDLPPGLSLATPPAPTSSS